MSERGPSSSRVRAGGAGWEVRSRGWGTQGPAPRPDAPSSHSSTIFNHLHGNPQDAAPLTRHRSPVGTRARVRCRTQAIETHQHREISRLNRMYRHVGAVSMGIEFGRRQSVRSIAIVGAGFSGTVMAINLLRLSGNEPLRVVLIDRKRTARGTAFADLPYPSLLTVPGGRMSATSAEPMEFVMYARRRRPSVTTADFLTRSFYGEYLESTLLAAELASPVAALRRVTG